MPTNRHRTPFPCTSERRQSWILCFRSFSPSFCSACSAAVSGWAFALIAVGFVGIQMFTNSPAGLLAATSIWTATNNWAVTALPLFIWMAEILHRTRLANDMFEGLAPWLIKLPGACCT